MKKLILLLSVFFLMTNCSRSSDNSTDKTASIVGTWYLSSFAVSGTVAGHSTPVNISQTTDTCMQKSTFVFNSNGTGSGTTYRNINSVCTQTASQTFTYTYNSSTKVITINDGTQTKTITLTSLNSTDFSFSESASNIDLGQYDSTLQGYIFTGTVTSNFKKK